MQHHEQPRDAVKVLDGDALLNSGQVKARCGNVSDMCIWRWMRDERVGFPKPLQINRRNYWRLGDLRDWQERHATDLRTHLETVVRQYET